MVRRNVAAIVIADAVDALAEDGWQLRQQTDFGSQAHAQLTSPRPNGLSASLSVTVTSVNPPSAVIQLQQAAAHEGASALAVALTLPPLRQLAWPESDRAAELTCVVSRRAATVRQTVEAAARFRAAFVDSFASPEELLALITSEVDGPAPRRYMSLRNGFLLAGAIGRLADAAELLSRLEADLPGDDYGTQTRFLRQARRWVDAGGPDVPALPQADPDRSRPPEHLLPRAIRAALEHSVAVREAEVRLSRRMRREPDVSTAELRRSLATDLAARGFPVSPAVAALKVERLRRERTLFGRTRERIRQAGVLVDVTKRTVHHVHSRSMPRRPVEAWPPDHAAYPVREARHGGTEVTLDPEGVTKLRELTAGNQVRVGPASHFDVWIDDDPDVDDAVTVYVGQQRVGRLDPELAGLYRDVLRRAGHLDERPRLSGVFLNLPEPVLSIGVPDPDREW